MRQSPGYHQILEDFSAYLEQAEEQAASLKELLTTLFQQGQLSAQCYELPRPRSDDDLVNASFIPVTRKTGMSGAALSIEALDDWYGVQGYSTKAVHRTPGVILIQDIGPGIEQEIVQRIRSINELKDAARSLQVAMKGWRERFEMTHKRHPMLIIPQLCRHILCFEGSPPLQSVTFTWGVKTEIHRISAKEAYEKIEVMARESQTTHSPERLARMMSDLEQLSRLPDDFPLVHRRELPIRPLANLLWVKDVEQRKKLREAHTPLVLINPPRDMHIGQLSSFDADKRRARHKRNDPRRLNLAPVTYSLALYYESG